MFSAPSGRSDTHFALFVSKKDEIKNNNEYYINCLYFYFLQDLKRKKEDIEVLEGNQAKLESKVSKYKEKCETLTETIKEHQTVQAELHEKVKAEAKTNAGNN
jgi:septal ring factor EnvC (AmiA/AmiB activator)